MNHTSDFFGGKIGDFTDFPPIFLRIDFSFAFSSRCRPKTDFSAINRPKKPTFLSMVIADHLSRLKKLTTEERVIEIEENFLDEQLF